MENWGHFCREATLLLVSCQIYWVLMMRCVSKERQMQGVVGRGSGHQEGCPLLPIIPRDAEMLGSEAFIEEAALFVDVIWAWASETHYFLTSPSLREN